MLALVLSAALAAAPAGEEAQADALSLCRPKLASDLSGEISALSINSSLAVDGWTVIAGPMTALIGMGDPAPGSASTHHLIRETYNYVCWVRGGKLIKVNVIPSP